MGFRPQILDPDAGRPLIDEAQLLGGPLGKVQYPVARKGAAIVHAHHGLTPVIQIGDLHIAGQRQRRMRRAQRILVKNLAIGGWTAVEVRAVPGRRADLVVIVLPRRNIPAPLDFVGASDFLGIDDLRLGGQLSARRVGVRRGGVHARDGLFGTGRTRSNQPRHSGETVQKLQGGALPHSPVNLSHRH